VPAPHEEVLRELQETTPYGLLVSRIAQICGAQNAASASGPPCRKDRALMPGKRVQFDDATWQALDLLAHDRMMDFQELADEAFRDLLRKHNRPTDLKSALRQSAGQAATVHKLPTKRSPPKGDTAD
jgi:hypothetical protein